MWGKLAKIFNVIDLLSRPSGATKKEIIEVSGTGDRQFYRLIESIQNLGVPVYDDKPDGEREKVWFIEKNYIKKLPNMTVPNPGFTLPELFILSFFKGSSSIFQNTDISRYADSSYAKLKGFVLDNRKETFEKVESAFISRARFSKDYSGWEDLLIDILGAIISRKRCIIDYNSFKSGLVKKYHVNPLHLFENDGGLYLMVQIEESGKIYTFAIERIKEIKINSETFEYPTNFDAAKFLNQSFGIFMDECFHCRVWFSADVSRYIKERRWADEQAIVENNDGSIILEMQTCGWRDVRRWVLSFGKESRILSPELMKTEIIDEISQAMDLYNNDLFSASRTGNDINSI